MNLSAKTEESPVWKCGIPAKHLYGLAKTSHAFIHFFRVSSSETSPFFWTLHPLTQRLQTQASHCSHQASDVPLKVHLKCPLYHRMPSKSSSSFLFEDSYSLRFFFDTSWPHNQAFWDVTLYFLMTTFDDFIVKDEVAWKRLSLCIFCSFQN